MVELSSGTFNSRRDRKLIVIVSPHFPPSSEVGARRVGAVAAALAAQGFEILVVSAVESTSALIVGATESCESGRENIKVLRTVFLPPLLLSRLVAVKRWFGGLVHKLRGGHQKVADYSATFRNVNLWDESSGSIGRGLVAVACVVDQYKKWSVSAYFNARKLLAERTPALVFVSGPAFSAVAAGTLLAKRYRVPLVADFRDPLFAEEVFEGFGRTLIVAICRRVEKLIVTSAAAITVASPGIARLLARHYALAPGKITVVTNGYDQPPPPRRTATHGRLDIVFAGALYPSRNPYDFLNALEVLLCNRDVRPNQISVKFFGAVESTLWGELRQWLEGKKCKTVVKIFPIAPLAELQPHLDAATVVLNLAQWQPNQIPAKTFEHLSLGCEILAICETQSDTYALLSGIDGALVVAPDAQDQMRLVLGDLYERHVVKGEMRPPMPEQIQVYSRQFQLRAMVSIVGQLLSDRSN